MPSTPEKQPGTSKHVHWADAASNFARSFRPSRRPVTPYPEEEEGNTKRKRGVPVVIGDPIVLQPAGVDPQQTNRYLPVYQAFVASKDGMSVPYEHAIPGYTRVNFGPQVAGSSPAGPRVNYFIPVEGAGVPLQALQVPVGFQPVPLAVAVSVPVGCQVLVG